MVKCNISVFTVECGEDASIDRLGLLVWFFFLQTDKKKKRIGQNDQLDISVGLQSQLEYTLIRRFPVKNARSSNN